ncbi:hypothetical protein IFU20_08325 [Pseudomonas viridiflava]|uniref:hypothetical protein n=1 Tax=Pseudomonas viridiflava TaxID=33069 RepID=UPI001785CC34|nr:hypothetical protein [Pseudomonas viridiflava]MBD8186181.1 hypothetical protein [Pseudomonas viridiflava]
MNTTHQDLVLQILTAVMLVNAQGKFKGLFDYYGHAQLDVRFYESDAFDIPGNPRQAAHKRSAWLDRELYAPDPADDTGACPITTSLIGMLEFVQSLLQTADQSKGEQAA